MTNAALKPCPFCGGRALYKAARCAEDAVEFWCECEGCEARTAICEDAYGDFEQAAAMWNSRSEKAA